jgi:hypothetical protein
MPPGSGGGFGFVLGWVFGKMSFPLGRVGGGCPKGHPWGVQRLQRRPSDMGYSRSGPCSHVLRGTLGALNVPWGTLETSGHRQRPAPTNTNDFARTLGAALETSATARIRQQRHSTSPRPFRDIGHVPNAPFATNARRCSGPGEADAVGADLLADRLPAAIAEALIGRKPTRPRPFLAGAPSL